MMSWKNLLAILSIAIGILSVQAEYVNDWTVGETTWHLAAPADWEGGIFDPMSESWTKPPYPPEAILTGVTTSKEYAKNLTIPTVVGWPLHGEWIYDPHGTPPLTAIRAAAFRNWNALECVTIPGTIKTIYLPCFRGCGGLTNITYVGGFGSGPYNSQDGVLYDRDMKKLFKYPEGKEGLRYQVPGQVESVAQYALANTKLKVVDFAGDAPVVSPSSASNTVLSGSSSLQKVTYPYGAKGWCNPWCGVKAVARLERPVVAAVGCPGGIHLTWSAVEHAVDYVIYYSDTSDKPEDMVPYDLSHESPMTMARDGGRSWPDRDFIDRCVRLDQKRYYCVVAKGYEPTAESDFSDVVSAMRSPGRLELKVEGMRVVGSEYVASSGVDDTGALKNGVLTIPDGVAEIGSRAFVDDPLIEKVVLPSSVEALDGAAFMYCPNLASVSGGNGLVSVGQDAFFGTTLLDDDAPVFELIRVGKCIVGCRGRNAIWREYDGSDRKHWGFTLVVPDGMVCVGGLDTLPLTGIVLPESLEEISQSCFFFSAWGVPDFVTDRDSFLGLTEVELPLGLEKLGDAAFYGWPNLTSVRTREPSELPPFDEEAARPKAKPGVWTTDADAVRTAAAEGGNLIVTLCADYETCNYTKAFAKIAESSTFLDWAKANGVYLLTMDESRMPDGCDDVFSASEMFDELYWSVPHDDWTINYPTLAISYAWDPEQAVGFDVARSGEKIGGVAYKGTAVTLIAGLSTYLTDRPAAGEGENKIVYALRGGENAWNNPATYSSDRRTVLAEPMRAGWFFKGWYPNDGVIEAGSSGVKTFTALWQKNEGTCEVDEVEWTYYYEGDGVIVGSADGETTAVPSDTAGEVTIPATIDGHPVIGIGLGAFYGCGALTRVWIPATVRTIGLNAFGACPLTAIDVDRGNARFVSHEGVLYNHDMTTLIRYPLGKQTIWPDIYEVPASVTKIASFAFARVRDKSVRFLGDAPTLEDNSCFNAAYGLSVFYYESRKGWWNWTPGERNVFMFKYAKPVSGFTATQGAWPFGVLLKWTVDSDTAVYYTLTRSEEPGGEETVLLAEDWYSKGCYLDSTAERGKTYYYSIVARTSAATGERGPAIIGYSAPLFDPSAAVKTYGVRFHANGGEGTMEDMCVTQGLGRVLSQNAFVNGGNKFYGWATSPDGVVEYGDCEVIFNLGTEGETVDLYAVWFSDRAAIGEGYLTVMTDEKAGGWSTSLNLSRETKMSGSCNWSNTGYTFTGWSFSPDGTVEITENEHFRFNASLYGWYYNGGGLLGTDDNVIKIYSCWKGRPYVIAYVGGAHDNVTGEMENQNCTYGDPVTLSSNRFARAGYVFDKWRERRTGKWYEEGEVIPCPATASFSTVDKVTFEAYWRYPVVNFRYDANGGEGVMPISRRSIYGTKIYVWHSDNAFYRDGYVLAGWSSSPDGDVEWLPGSYLYPDETWTEGRELVFYAVWRKLDGSPIWNWSDCRVDRGKGWPWMAKKTSFDGYLIRNDELLGTVVLSIGEGRVVSGDDVYASDATVRVVREKESVDTCAVRDTTPSRVDTGDVRLTVGRKGFYGTYGEFETYGGYNGFGIAGSDEARAIESVIGYYTMALSDGTHVQLSVKSKGVVAVSGTFADGAKLASTAQVVLGEDAFYIPIYALPTKTADGLRVLVKLTVDEERVTVGAASKVMVDHRGGVSEELALTASGRIITKIAVKGYDPGTSTACGVAYSGRVIIDDLAYPATFSAKGLPPGLKINADTGVVSGVPTKPGRYAVQVTVTSGVDKSQKTMSEVEMSIDNYTDETIPVADSYGPFVPGVPMALRIDGGEGWSVSGLPSGTKWNKSLPGIVGAPTKPGASTVVFSWNEGSLVHKASSTLIIGPLPKLSVSSVGAGTGKVTGAGAYAANAKVTLKATADGKDSPATSKNGATVKSVFAGWYGDAECAVPMEGAVDYRNSSYPYVMPSEDVVLYARFVPAAGDVANLTIANIAEGEVFTVNGEWQKKIEVNSYSLPTVSVKGLPAGLKFDAKALTISGKPTKPGTYAVELSLKNVSVKTAKKHTFKIVVPNLESGRITGGVSYKSDAYTYVAGTHVAPILPVLEDGWTLKASGLPSGLKLTGGKNGAPYAIEGTPTAKPGSYTVTLSLTKGKEKDVATLTINIENRTLTLVVADCEGSHTNGCKVSGGGSYAAGKKVALKATATAYKKATAKTPGQLATVFAGWYRDSGCRVPLEGVADFRTTSYAYVTKAEDETIYAKFVPATADTMIGLVVNGEDVVDDSGDVRVVVKDAATLPAIELVSVSIPKVSVEGLPAGMKWDGKANRFTGAPTKPGIYKVSVSLTNTTVKKAIVRAFTVEVPNFVSPAFPGLKPESDAYPMSVGVSKLPNVDAGLAPGFDGYTIKVAGLPSGLSFKNGVLAGLTKKAGDYTVTFTATKGKDKQVSTITLHVEALPDWTVGTFVGMVRQIDRDEGGAIIEDEDGRHDWYDILTTVSVTSAGKVSGKMHFESGTEISFKYDSISERTDDGFLMRGRLTARGIAAEVELLLRKVWLEPTGAGGVGAVDVMIQQIQRQEGKAWVDCEQSTFSTDEDMPLRQNVWTSKTLPLPPNINGNKETVTVGDDIYTLAFGKSGSVKVSLAKVTTPTKAYATGTTTLSILRREPEVWHCELCVSLVVKKNDYGATCVFDVTISANGTVTCTPR